MESIQINLDKYSYNIHIGKNLLDDLEMYMEPGIKWMVVTDENVDRLYGDKIDQALQNRSYKKYCIKPGEESKGIETVMEIISFMTENQWNRKDKMIAFGGGVVGDVAGFCASIYMRGIGLIQIPTTLLAQVDSSVGGKTGINTATGKNIIGTFYQPEMVLMDMAVLRTLSNRDFMSGLAEVVKYGVIYDGDFLQEIGQSFAKLRSKDPESLCHVVKRCCEIKGEIVSQDEREKGLRKILNYGHTFGHALEALTAYRVYTHGEAVWMGMYYELRIAKHLGVVEEGYYHELEAFFQTLQLDLDIRMYHREHLIDKMLHDKKNQGERISFVLPISRGCVKEFHVKRKDIWW